MKKTKSALCLVTLLATCAALASCNKPTQSNDGTIFTYTTAQGKTISYTASELLKSYQTAGNSASTEFDKVYEVLIRKLYTTDEYKDSLAKCEREAESSVASQIQTASKNADSNGTTVREELEKIFDNLNVDNLVELKDYYLYQEEKKQYENDWNNNNLASIRDGSADGLMSDEYLMPASDNYGIENKGWIKEQVPMNIRHILVKVSAASGDYTQGEISEDKSSAGEATKLATMIMRLAGANTQDGTTKANGDREEFWQIAKDSEDTSSAANYGELDNPMTKVMESDLVNEFKLGTYAFETLYNQAYKNTTGDEKKFYDSNVATLTPGLTEGATEVNDDTVDEEQALDDADNTTIYDFFKNGETNDAGQSTGIGQIPYGAAVALLKAAKITTDDNNTEVWGGKATFYPRNILFNKYFNKHNICVITPNEIAYNDSSVSAESYNGVYSEKYSALPGFQFDTKNVLPDFEHNVLTNDEGNIILAVRAGASSYQGVHFIVIQRSGLDLDGSFYTPQVTDDAATTSTLSEYYTMYKPGESGYPTATVDGQTTDKLTYVNYNNESKSQSATWNTRQSRISSALKNYNGALSTYIFQQLIEGGTVKFKDEDMEKRIQNYSATKRLSTKDSNYETWTNNWKTYAEMIEEQNRQRSMEFNFANEGGTYKGNATSKKHMLSEVCAIGYGKHNSKDWEEGGRCYYVQ